MDLGWNTYNLCHGQWLSLSLFPPFHIAHRLGLMPLLATRLGSPIPPNPFKVSKHKFYSHALSLNLHTKILISTCNCWGVCLPIRWPFLFILSSSYFQHQKIEGVFQGSVTSEDKSLFKVLKLGMVKIRVGLVLKF